MYRVHQTRFVATSQHAQTDKLRVKVCFGIRRFQGSILDDVPVSDILVRIVKVGLSSAIPVESTESRTLTIKCVKTLRYQTQKPLSALVLLKLQHNLR